MELKDTIKMMNSEDFKERFKAEYYQTKTRYDKLHKMLIKYEAGSTHYVLDKATIKTTRCQPTFD